MRDRALSIIFRKASNDSKRLQLKKSFSPSMVSLILLGLLCGSCMAAEATDVSSQISELIKEFQQHTIGTRDFQTSDIKLSEVIMKDTDKEEVNKIIALSEIVEKNIHKSQAFWEKLEKKEEIDDAEITKERKRMTNLMDFVEKVQWFLGMDMNLGGGEDEFCEKTLNDVVECFSWLGLLRSHNEEDDGPKRMDFQAVRKALSYYVDYIKFLHLNLVLFDRLSNLFPELTGKIKTKFQNSCTDKFWKDAELFYNEYNGLLSYLDNSNFKAYASAGRQKANEFFEKTRALIEKCEETSAKIDKLLGEEKCVDTARSLLEKLEKLNVKCDRRMDSMLSSGFNGFKGSNIVEEMLMVAEYYEYMIRLAKLQHVSHAYQKALAQY